MSNTITVNGVEYVEKGEGFKDSEHVCVIADRGWIFEGYRDDDTSYRLANANVVRRWDNGLGIGGIAKAEHKDDYTLDAVGSIEINPKAVIAMIPLEW